MRLAHARLIKLVALIVAATGMPLGVANADIATKPIFAAAELAPSNVTTCLCIENAAEIRADLAGRPIAGLVEQVFKDADLRQAWRNLAARANLDEGTLFDAWLGRRFTLFICAGEETYDWAVMAEVDPKKGRDLLARMNPLRRAPRSAVPVSELPECELLIASLDESILIGPSRPSPLFDHLLRRMAGGEPARVAAKKGGTLAEHKAFATSRSLGRGTAGLFVRHGDFLGGWSVLVFRRAGESITIRHAARFDEPPFERPLTETRLDASLLDAFDDAALLAVIEPTDIGDGPIERFAQSILGVPLISEAMRRNIDDARIITFGEVDGRQEPHATDLLVPTGAVAIRMKDPRAASPALDRNLLRMARAVESLGDGAFDIDIPPLSSMRAGIERHVDLQPALRHLGEGFPMMQSVTLNWAVADGPDGSFYVVATHPQHLGQTVDALKTGRRGSGCTGKWTNCGTFDGRRLGVHLRSYVEQADLLASADPGDAKSFRDTMLVVSELAAGIDRCRWHLNRPTRKTMRLEVKLTLSPPESASDH